VCWWLRLAVLLGSRARGVLVVRASPGTLTISSATHNTNVAPCNTHTYEHPRPAFYDSIQFAVPAHLIRWLVWGIDLSNVACIATSHTAVWQHVM